MSDAMRSAAWSAGLTVVPYESDLGFTAVRENDGGYFVFVLNSGEWMIYRAEDAMMMANGCGPSSLLVALRRHFEIADALPAA